MYPTQPQEKNQFTMRKSYCDVYKTLNNSNPTNAAAFMNALIDYALYEIIPEKDNIVWQYGIQVIFERMDEDNKDTEKSIKYTTRKYEGEIEREQLDIIANLLNQGYKQVDICKQLNKPKSTINDRCRKIRTKYPEMLREKNSESSENLIESK